MRVLLDHCVPRPLGRLLVGHEVRTAREMGWDDIDNGELLALAAAEFDVMVTVDRHLMHQQDVGVLALPVIVVVSVDSRIDALTVFVPEVMSLLGQDLARRVYVVPETADGE